MRQLMAISVSLVLIGLAYVTFRVGRADWLDRSGSVDNLKLAALLAPQNASYARRIAGIMDSPMAIPQLERALALNPRDTRGRIELALLEEMQGDFSRAEADLLAAAKNDRTFEPRWTLANFYFRRRNSAGFWQWAAQAANAGYFNLDSLFRLCWQASRDSDFILERVIPENPQIQRQYLGFLLRENRLSAARTVVDRLLASVQEPDREVLLDYCDRVLEHYPECEVQPAIRVWNSLCSRKWIGLAELAPARGLSLTNGDFSLPPLRRGFDWRTPSVPGISVSWQASELRVLFSGKQPEACDVLQQFVPVLPNAAYLLNFEYGNTPSSTGIGWRIVDGRTNKNLISPAGATRSPIRFSTLAGADLIRLVLSYQREPGTSRIEGSVAIRKVALHRVRLQEQ